MILLLLAACGTPKPDDSAPSQQPEVTPPATEVSFSPEVLDFGVLGAPGSATLTVTNEGDALITLEQLSASSTDLSFESSTSDLPPGGSSEVTVSWSPLAPGDLSDIIRVLIMSSESGATELTVPVSGTASWPVMTLDVGALDLGTVKVGCDNRTAVTVTNNGTTDLVIDSLSLANGVDFKLAAAEGELPALPWTLTPGASQAAELVFTPMDEVASTDVVTAVGNDPITPSASVEITALGTIEAQNSISFDVVEPQAATIFVGVNDYAISSSWGAGTKFYDALPTFFETLQDAGGDYRVTFSTLMNASVNADVEYLDQDDSVDDSVTITTEMVDVGGMLTDNDYMLTTFGNALELHRAWMLDESDKWAESKLSLIAINNDTEQSTGAATVHVAEYQTYKSDPADVVVDAISGPIPRGCSGAEPAELLDSAVTATGGTFLSFCEADWTSHMETLALAAIGAKTQFELTGDPAEWSIEVYVDGVEVTEGWTYDAEHLEVEFDDDAYPVAGSLVRVDYLMNTTCE